MRTALPLPEPLLRRSFTLSESDACGVSRKRTRASDLRTVSRGIRVPVGVEQSLAQRIRPYLALLPDAVVSDATAAKLHGIPLPPGTASEELLHLTRPCSSSGIQRKGILGHRRRLEAAEIGLAEGIPVTSIARTWIDLASRMGLDDLIAAADWIISEHDRGFGPPRVAKLPADELAGYVSSRHGFRSVRNAAAALNLMRVGVDSPPESLLRLMLLRAELPEFAVNCRINSPQLPRSVWADLGNREFRVCVEYDGLHHLTPEQQASDNERDALTASAGWRQVKVNRLQLRQAEPLILAPIRRALQDNGWRGAADGNGWRGAAEDNGWRDAADGSG